MLSLLAARRSVILLVNTGLSSIRLQHAQMQYASSDPRRRLERAKRTAFWAQGLLETFGIADDVRGEFPRSPFLLVANHRSAIDIGMLLAHAPVSLVARADLEQWPVFGFAARSVGTVFVDRSAAASGAATLRSLVDALRAGQSMAIFPEGYTFEGDEVRPFQPGVALAAFMAKVPVVPVGLAYESGSRSAYVDMSFAEHVARVASSPASRVSMCIGDPMLPPSREERATYTERVRLNVQQLVHEARARVDSQSSTTGLV